MDNSDSAESIRKLPPKLRHDLKNELNAMSLGLGVVLDQVRDGQPDEAIEVIEQLISHLEMIQSQCSASPTTDG